MSSPAAMKGSLGPRATSVVSRMGMSSILAARPKKGTADTLIESQLNDGT